MKNLILCLTLLFSVGAMSQEAPDTADPNSNTGLEAFSSASDALLESMQSTPELNHDANFNSLNIPKEAFSGPRSSDLAFTMIRYILGDVAVEAYKAYFESSPDPDNEISTMGVGIMTGTTAVLGIMAGIAIIVTSAIMSYTLIFGLLFTNVTGKPMGDKWNSVYIAIRSAMSISLIQPIARFSGLAGIQVVLLIVALIAIGFAGAVYRVINYQMLTRPVVSYHIQDLEIVYNEVLFALACERAFDREEVTKSQWREFFSSIYPSSPPYKAAVADGLGNTLWRWMRRTDTWIYNHVAEGEESYTKYEFNFGPAGSCGTITLGHRDYGDASTDQWAGAVEDIYGTWVGLYYESVGSRYLAEAINAMRMTSLLTIEGTNTPTSSTVDPSASVSTDRFFNMLDEFHELGDATTEANAERAAVLKGEIAAEYRKIWGNFRGQISKFTEGESGSQLESVNMAIADKLSNSGFFTAGFSFYIWQQRQEKLNSAFNKLLANADYTAKIDAADPEDRDRIFRSTNIVNKPSKRAEVNRYMDSFTEVTQWMAFNNYLPTDFSNNLKAIAKAETDDSALGGWLGSINYSLQKTLMGAPRLFTGSTYDNPDPLMEIKAMGDTIMTVTGIIAAGSTVGKIRNFFRKSTKVFSSDSKKGGSGQAIGTVMALIMSALVTLGVLYSYFIPAIPFTLFTISVAGYLSYLLAILAASPIWVAVWSIPDGHDVFGRGGQGFSMVAVLILKPIFMMIGLVAGNAVLKSMGFYMNSTFLPTMYAMHSGFNPFTLIGNLVLYGIIMTILTYKSYSLISEIGELMFAMIGVNNAHSNFFGEQQTMTTAVAMQGIVASNMSSGLQRGVGQIFNQAKAGRGAGGGAGKK